MRSAERRTEFRIDKSLRFSPIDCYAIVGTEKISLDVINFHYRGACFRANVGDYRIQNKSTYLTFKIGEKDLPERIQFRLVWETISENGCFGVEFTAESAYVLSRAERFSAHAVNAPIISSQDPLDPNRIIYFKAVNVSTTGMLISTSLTNKHLFPGMELRTAVLEIPGMGKTDVDLFIENSRSAGDNKNVLYGVSIKGTSHNYIELISKYLSNLGMAENANDRLDKLVDANLIHKSLSKHLTIKQVQSEKEYQDVLKLRFVGYKLAGKTDPKITWRDMGDGLEKEGMVIVAYLGGQLIATAEFRILKKHGLRISEKIDILAFPEIKSDNLAEVNKLVVHPKAQNTDVVLGIFQKIHVIAMLNGRPDGIIAAEDKLVPLYERLGFRKIGYSYPHPVKVNTKLNLMVIRSEAYASSENMNPYAWSVAFSETQKFLSEIGIQRALHLSLKQKFVKYLTFAIVKIFKKKKKSKNSQPGRTVIPEPQVVRNTTDPKWTKQHINATVLLPYILEAEEMIGAEKVAKILLEFGFEPKYFRSLSNWVSIDFFNGFIDEFIKYGDPYALNRRAGYRSTTREILGSNYFLVKHFISPALAFKSFERYLPKFNKTRIYKVIESSPTGCRIRITNPDPCLLPKHRSSRENWHALIEAYVKVITRKPGEVTIVKSSFDGDAYCEYLVKWQNPVLSVRNLVFWTITLIGLSQAYSKLEANLQTQATIITLGSIFIIGFSAVAFRKWTSYKRKYLDMLDSLTTFESDADERYRELQASKSILEQNYQEGKLLENIGKEVQRSEDLTKIFNIALDSICTNFEFKRAFAMILDEDQKILQTVAAHGAESIGSDIWKFKVDVSARRENPMVLSSVFHTGQSILITNVDEHKFHLNEISRGLIERLQTSGFAIVPIPSENKNWGVMIADKGENGQVITRRDLVSLQRVSQSIGMALDKKAKIESEFRVRKIFQKYVPSAVVESTLGIQDPKLGGENRDTICLFMDIRNFTQMSMQVPPQILCELLNKIFDLLQKSISPTNGIIDKFLGDGALVTWGAVPGSELNPSYPLTAIDCFCKKLQELNSDLITRGLSPIEVGFGVHRGISVAGNIGSTERMEFTVIGTTVNVASRLEQLTKVFKCQVVVSDSLLPFENLDKGWEIHTGIQIRGLTKPINVASMRILQLPPEKKVETA